MKLLRFVIWMFMMLPLTASFAQMTIKPIARVAEKNKIKNGRSEATSLTLPFWDDFSRSNGVPIDSLWIESENIWINNGMGINPPSLNVATFDGFDATGKPYSLDGLSDGLTDVLTSQGINLSNNVPNDFLYLSFFYQAKGNGEIPNENDSLRVEFIDFDGDWHKAWSITGKDIVADTFKLVALPIVNSEYFSESFQFRFLSYGRQSGPFDTWNIDYVYLNDNVTNVDFPDRALQSEPSSLFVNYTDIPIHHFNQDPTILLEFPTSKAYNLFDLLQPSNFSMIAQVESLQPDLSMLSSMDTLAAEVISSFPDPLTGPRIIDLVANKKLNPSKVSSDTLATIELMLFMNTDDNEAPDYQPEFSPLDFRVNDTTKTYHTLHDYYAYDDGKAEFAAGLNFAGDKVAYEFPMFFTGVDTLVSVDMYFPNLRGNIGGQVIELMIYSTLDSDPSSLLYSESISLTTPESINQFTNYPLALPVLVMDTFYIGWEQTSGGNLDIGLDKNTDSGDMIYFNLDGSWRQNTQVRGSLMLRPKFGKADIILGFEDEYRSQISIYPNPSKNKFHIKGPIDILGIYDLMGRIVPYKISTESNHQIIDLDSPQGIYLLKYREGSRLFAKRLIVN